MISTSQIKSKSGTLGGYVQRGDEQFALTCAHVLFSMKDLGPNINTVSSVCTASGHKIGDSVVGVFHHGKSNETSLDAALFRINQNFEVNGSFPYIPVEALRRLGFNSKQQPSYWCGETVDVYERKKLRNPVVKYGSESRLTTGTLAPEECHVRIQHLSLLLEETVSRMKERKVDSDLVSPVDDSDVEMTETTKETLVDSAEFVMFSQAEIESHTYSHPFFHLGDSGSLVFYVDEDDSLKCVGLAIGSTSFRTCIKTPIRAVLKALYNAMDPDGVGPPLQMKPFSPPASKIPILSSHDTEPLPNTRGTEQETRASDSTTQFPFDPASFMTMISESVGKTLDQKLAPMNKNIERINARFGAVERSLSSVHANLEEMDARVGSVENNVGNMTRKRTTENVDDSDDEDL